MSVDEIKEIALAFAIAIGGFTAGVRLGSNIKRMVIDQIFALFLLPQKLLSSAIASISDLDGDGKTESFLDELGGAVGGFLSGVGGIFGA